MPYTNLALGNNQQSHLFLKVVEFIAGLSGASWGVTMYMRIPWLPGRPSLLYTFLAVTVVAMNSIWLLSLAKVDKHHPWWSRIKYFGKSLSSYLDASSDLAMGVVLVQLDPSDILGIFLLTVGLIDTILWMMKFSYPVVCPKVEMLWILLSMGTEVPVLVATVLAFNRDIDRIVTILSVLTTSFSIGLNTSFLFWIYFKKVKPLRLEMKNMAVLSIIPVHEADMKVDLSIEMKTFNTLSSDSE